MNYGLGIIGFQSGPRKVGRLEIDQGVTWLLSLLS